VSNDVEFLDQEPARGNGSSATPRQNQWLIATLGWALAAALSVVAPFLPFAVYPRWHGGPANTHITLKEISLNGWTTGGEEPRVGIILVICAALFAANAAWQVWSHRSPAGATSDLRGHGAWAGLVAAPAVLLGVLAMIVVYLLTGTTRRAQLPAPTAAGSPVSKGSVAHPVSSLIFNTRTGVSVAGPVHTALGAAGQPVFTVVRSADLYRSGCLWLAVAAAVLALVVPLGTDT
jgi:hypothetical protein